MQDAGRAGGTPEVIAEATAGMLLVGAMVFGGGPRGAGDAVVHLLAAPALVLAILRWRHADATGLQRLFLYWLIAAAAVVGLQLLPLPASVFAALPQRAAVLADLREAGAMPAWLPMTLDAWGAVRSLLAFAMFAAMWLLASTLSQRARQRLLMLALLAAVPMLLLGFAQAAAGTHAPLRFHAYHHRIGAIGLFANRNHYADLLALLLPFALAFAVQAQRQQRKLLAAAWYALGVGLLLATALSYSRAGIALAMLAVALSAVALRPTGGADQRRLMPLSALGIAALAVAAYAWDGIATRLAQDPIGDLRWQYLRYGFDTFVAYLPWGSGVGSFRWAYAPLEPVVAMTGVFADRAHDDVLQLGIEAGIPGLVLLLALLAMLVAAAARTLRPGSGAPGARDGFGKAACIALLVPMLHSLVDYPLRTLAIACVAGLALSVLLAAPPDARGGAPSTT